MIGEVPSDDLRQPSSLFVDGLVHSLPQRLLDLPEPRPHAVAPGPAGEQEVAPTAAAADEDEAQEGEGLRLAEPTLRAPGRRSAAELDQAGLLRMKRQRELLQSCTRRFQETPRVRLVLEA